MHEDFGRFLACKPVSLIKIQDIVSHVAEKAGYQKLVGQYIQKALLDADDPNLIDEEGITLNFYFCFPFKPSASG